MILCCLSLYLFIVHKGSGGGSDRSPPGSKVFAPVREPACYLLPLQTISSILAISSILVEMWGRGQDDSLDYVFVYILFIIVVEDGVSFVSLIVSQDKFTGLKT